MHCLACSGADAGHGQIARLLPGDELCADFMAGAHLDNGNPEVLLSSMTRFFRFLPGEQRQRFLSCLDQKAS